MCHGLWAAVEVKSPPSAAKVNREDQEVAIQRYANYKKQSQIGKAFKEPKSTPLGAENSSGGGIFRENAYYRTTIWVFFF